ncbi:protein of unknown function [Citrobacter amalonaticus]|uniref:Uncharacterized protein n=1 Tax=Citrobacter amalonaticus TaxID=35703 RepID=A0AAX2BCS6_CITAM|nr:protein of unknown function [Citrobacter amalonaticus]SAZ20219.1 protein of unknown function [Citrobacter amalonaticus]
MNKYYNLLHRGYKNLTTLRCNIHTLTNKKISAACWLDYSKFMSGIWLYKKFKSPLSSHISLKGLPCHRPSNSTGSRCQTPATTSAN